MEVKVFEPHKKLVKYIRSYFFIHTTNNSHDSIPPLGYPVLQFHFHNKINEYFKNYSFVPNNILIIGQLTKHANIHPPTGVSLIGVNFATTGLYNMLNCNMKQFMNTALPATQYFNISIKGLHKSLYQNKNSHHKQVKLLNNYFMHYVDKIKINDVHIDKLVDFIEQRNGFVKYNEILDMYPASERTIQRKFNQIVGVSPKSYCRILRHLNFFIVYKNKGGNSFTELLFKSGYYDAAHFTKDFKLMAGVSPAAYFQNDERFAHLLSKDR